MSTKKFTVEVTEEADPLELEKKKIYIDARRLDFGEFLFGEILRLTAEKNKTNRKENK